MEQPLLREAAAVGFSGVCGVFLILDEPGISAGDSALQTWELEWRAASACWAQSEPWRASGAGRLADRKGARWVVGLGVALSEPLGYLVLWVAGYHMAGLVIGVSSCSTLGTRRCRLAT